MSAQTRSEIAGLLESHGLTPRRHLGQHFLADPNITRKIVAVADVSEGDHVLEVGAGTGTLTSALAAAGARVIAYEVDTSLEPVLEEAIDGLDVQLRFADVMSVSLDEVDSGTSWKLVANLPYNVGTPFLLEALQNLPQIELFVVMVQREVAERLCASPGGREYGIPSVVAQIYSRPRIEFTVPPQVFYPAPRVDSAVVVMLRVPAPEGAGTAVELAGRAFRQRRKMLRSSLKGILSEPERRLEEAGLEATARAEDLSPDDYLALARVVS